MVGGKKKENGSGASWNEENTNNLKTHNLGHTNSHLVSNDYTIINNYWRPFTITMIATIYWTLIICPTLD